MPPRTRTFSQFLKAWNAPLSSRDAVEEHPWRLTDLARDLGDGDREQAVAFLRAQIRGGDATLPAIVAGGARLHETVGALEQALERARGWEKAEVAMALGRLTRKKRRTVNALIEAAREGGCQEVVIALGAYRGEDVVQALLEALEDDDNLVRAHAADSLLAAAGFGTQQGVRFGRVRTYLSGGHPALRRYGRKCFRS